MSGMRGRKFLGVMFNCCRAYGRIYINKEGTHYQGACPKCGKRVRVRIDPRTGINARFFETT